MTGGIFNTLTYHVNKIEREWRANSSLRKQYSYGSLKQILFFLSKKPLQRSFLIFLAFGFITIILNIKIIDKLLHPYQTWLIFSDIQKADLATYFISIWGIQTTIAALIYPIVISFVSLLLQGRNDTRSYLNIYLHDTASIFSGLSSLFLVLLMGLQFIFLPTTHKSELLNWIYLDLLYLDFNIVLVTYFLYQTFLYMRPSSRKDSLKKYLINEIWPCDFKALVLPKVFSGSEDDNSLLKIKEHQKTDPASGKKLSIRTDYIYESETNRFEEYLNYQLNQERELVNIRFFFLKLACQDWAKKALNNESENQVLAILVRPGYRYKGNIQLCKVKGESKINWYQKVLFRFKGRISTQITVQRSTRF